MPAVHLIFALPNGSLLVSVQERAKWESMMPVEEMNMEEALAAVPHLVVNPNKPSMWPHDTDYDEYVAELKAKGVDEGH